MRFAFYTHSLVSDWNHGNAHFLRGLMRALQAKGHEAFALQPANGWSRTNLETEAGPDPEQRFADTFPSLHWLDYDAGFDHEAACQDADVVIVHEWTDPELVTLLGRLRLKGGQFLLYFHDTHHRAVSRESEIAGLDLNGYDGVLAFGEALRQRYIAAGWGRQVETFHEAADVALFRPVPDIAPQGDLVWVGNWGDDERTEELHEYLIEPSAQLGLDGIVHGVRYPSAAREALQRAGLRYGGWIANQDVPVAFARHRFTIHVPRRPYVKSLPGIPTIRMFEALACGIPLISAPWDDCEGLFLPGADYLVASNGRQMTECMRALLHEPELGAAIAASGLERVRAAHTCDHRAEQLLSLVGRHRNQPATEVTE
ncbi:CgeB family protein [Stappia indica]|uniref:CgeB family protein n=1 Tax=Stappia indica TaxID=538381 RepID=UPI00082D757E|nr:glycosyltransferase [Stappia indica]